MLPKEKKMELLEPYDLTKSIRAAGQLTGVDHHTVANAGDFSWRSAGTFDGRQWGDRDGR